jgi:arylsulfatase A-like enzyme
MAHSSFLIPIMPPNILILHAHDMGRYCSPYGFQAPTPRMQALAEEGLLFRHAHCAAPTCSPSRAALLTGHTAHQAGMLGLVHRGFGLADDSRHLAAYLGRQGYETILAGIQHEIQPERETEVYRQRLPSARSHGREGDARTAEQVAEHLRSPVPSAGPWFLWAGFFLPHRPFLPADPAVANPRYVRPPEPLPDTPRTRRDMAEYYASLAATDAAVGTILDALDQSGQAGNTLVLLTTDHGIAFPHMKCKLTAHGTGVTLVVRHPRWTGKGVVSDALVSHLDLYPTLCELADIPIPEWCIGHSLGPLLQTGIGEVREDVFAEVNFHAAAEPMRSVRTKRYSYIRLFDDDPRLPVANTDGGDSKDELLESGWREKPRESIQLYDLMFDPTESHNLATDPHYAVVRQEMTQRLQRWMEQTEDPLLEGPLVLPEGARINTRESLDPEVGPFVPAGSLP